jgi:hypothetical protein
LTAACGEDPTAGAIHPGENESAIIGGTLAIDADYPAVGALLYKIPDPHLGDTGGFLCTGTLIAPDVVLMAAHCLMPSALFGPGVEPAWYFSFSLDVTDYGYVSLDLPAKTYEAAKAVPNPLYDPAYLNTFTGGLATFHDVGLLFLKVPVTDRTPAIVLAANDAATLAEDTAVEIVGYGARDQDYDPNSTDPDDAGIKVLATSSIHELGETEMQIGDVAPTPQKCHGDSGGPPFRPFSDGLLPAERVIGVTSHSYDQTDCHKGGVDTRVDVYRPWIDIEMKKACTDQVRTACADGGGLPVPSTPPVEGQNGSRRRCSAINATPTEASLVAAVFLGICRRRRRG